MRGPAEIEFSLKHLKEGEVTCVKKAAFLAASAMQKFFVQELERARPC